MRRWPILVALQSAGFAIPVFLLVAIFAGALLVMGCARRPEPPLVSRATAVPPDLQIMAGQRGLSPGSGGCSLSLYADGRGVFHKDGPIGPGAPSSRASIDSVAFRVEPARLLEVWRGIEENGYFELAHLYQAEGIYDGTITQIFVRAHGVPTMVIVVNAPVPRFEDVLRVIRSAAPETLWCGGGSSVGGMTRIDSTSLKGASPFRATAGPPGDSVSPRPRSRWGG